MQSVIQAIANRVQVDDDSSFEDSDEDDEDENFSESEEESIDSPSSIDEVNVSSIPSLSTKALLNRRRFL